MHKLGMMAGTVNAGVGFLPTDISGLVLWLDSTDNDTILNASDLAASNGENVKTWQDKSGNDYHVTQSTVNRQPIYKTSAVALSKPVIHFDDVVNSTALQRTTDSIQTTGSTMFMAFSNANAGGPNSIIMSGGNANGHLITENGAVSGGTEIVMTAGAAVNPADYMFDTGYALAMVWNGASSKHYQNGVLQGTANAGTLTSSGITIGAFRTGAAPADIQFGEVLYYDSVLDDAQVATVSDYLASKYGF